MARPTGLRGTPAGAAHRENRASDDIATRRRKGDRSQADVRAPWLDLILSIVALACAILYLFQNESATYSRSDQDYEWGFNFAVSCGISALILLLVTLPQLIVVLRRAYRHAGRREMLVTLSRPWLRRLRWSALLLSAVALAVCWGVFFLFVSSVHPSAVVALACLAAFCLSHLLELSEFGDQAYAAAIALVVATLALPVLVDSGNAAALTAYGLLAAFTAGGMSAAWYLQWPRTVWVGAPLAGGFVLLATMAYSPNSDYVAPLVAVCGTALAILAVSLGAGRPLSSAVPEAAVADTSPSL